ncbi:hypothetical protein HQ36_05285 [Porphyromonas gingivicanis]|uniref:Uncharacterized protein n=1 Tax=Porphyromonas gingivicanis TaxID=266762 RepID=A0A0A2G5P0_9PORP|nr:hypothetical protein [Porphyromonas gingivicanis]KGN97690.1 hypothetical protein HQ36_05285 [Porphyromonas gingivicanis]
MIFLSPIYSFVLSTYKGRRAVRYAWRIFRVVALLLCLGWTGVSCQRSPSMGVPRPLELILQHDSLAPIAWSDYHFSLHDVATGLYAPIKSPTLQENGVLLSFGKPSLSEQPSAYESETQQLWGEGTFVAQLTIYDAKHVEQGRVRFRVRTFRKDNKVEVTDLLGHDGFATFHRIMKCYSGVCSIFFVRFDAPPASPLFAPPSSAPLL